MRKCPCCNQDLVRRRDEGLYAFNARIYCNRQCSAKRSPESRDKQSRAMKEFMASERSAQLKRNISLGRRKVWHGPDREKSLRQLANARQVENARLAQQKLWKNDSEWRHARATAMSLERAARRSGKSKEEALAEREEAKGLMACGFMNDELMHLYGIQRSWFSVVRHEHRITCGEPLPKSELIKACAERCQRDEKYFLRFIQIAMRIARRKFKQLTAKRKSNYYEYITEPHEVCVRIISKGSRYY